MNAIRTALKGRLSAQAPTIVSHPSRTVAAVLVPFFLQNDEPYLLFTKRSDSMQHHRNEISFPGGTRDPGDPDLEHTALRELHEEVAVPPENVEVLGSMDPIYTYSSSFIVVPFVGILKDHSECHANGVEVEEILRIPLQHFRDSSIFHEEEFVLENRTVPVYYYRWQSHTIWGLTGRILKILLDLLQEGVRTQ
jgi:8-oxo-dGTP pyrophosphatase MutT (NUDIX family)